MVKKKLIIKEINIPSRNGEFENIVLRSNPDGSQLLVSDVAVVKDSFQESSTFVHFDRESAVTLGIFSLENQNLLAIDKAVKTYIEEKSKQS